MSFKSPEPTHPLYQKKILSIDYGSKVIGLACYHANRDPYPLSYGRVLYKSIEQVLSELKIIISDEFIDIIVVGVPYLTDGTATKQTKQNLHFIKELEKITNLPLYQQDETLSTYAAEERMKSSPAYNFKVDLKKIDEVSACIILEDFIANSHESFPL